MRFRRPGGAPLFIDAITAGGTRWIGAFAAGGLGGVAGVYATPNPDAVCVLNGGLAYLVDVMSPEDGARIAHDQVGQVVAHNEPDLLLLVRFVDIVAIGPNGVAWHSGRVAVDDLRVVSASRGTIVCTLDNLGASESITLNAANGQQVAGTRLKWPPGAL